MRNKYASLTNHYRTGDIEKQLRKHKDFNECKYIVYEKLDGSNVSVEIHKDKFVFNSRNQSLGNDITKIGFNGLGVAMEEHLPMLEWFQQQLESDDDVIILYGEYFGGNIQRRVDYGARKRVLFFDAFQDGKYATQRSFLAIMEMAPRGLMSVAPIVDIVDSIDDALAIDPHVRSLEANPENEGSCYREGNVIKPFNISPHIGEGVFYIKYKNSDFEERTRHVDPEKLYKIRQRAIRTTVFKEYLNENRVLSFLSKGYENTEKNYGTIIQGVLKDAFKDYNEEKPEGYVELEAKEIKKLGANVVEILRGLK
jgi:Rnl2 family RNA ligase